MKLSAAIIDWSGKLIALGRAPLANSADDLTSTSWPPFESISQASFPEKVLNIVYNPKSKKSPQRT